MKKTCKNCAHFEVCEGVNYRSANDIVSDGGCSSFMDAEIKKFIVVRATERDMALVGVTKTDDAARAIMEIEFSNYLTKEPDAENEINENSAYITFSNENVDWAIFEV